MTDAIGPVFMGGFEPIPTGDDGRAILYLPDKHNSQLQREGKPPVYYYLPSAVRLARKNGSTGDYKFHLIHFVGVRGDGTTVGVGDKQELSGGVLSLTTTAGFPIETLRASQEAFLATVKGKDVPYWGWNTQVRPVFRPMPIVSCVTALSNLSPQADGTVPSTDPRVRFRNTPRDPGVPFLSREERDAKIAEFNQAMSTRGERSIDISQPIPRQARNLDPWFWKLGGDGKGSVIPDGENAFSGLVGSIPAALLWEGFHGSYSPLVVSQSLQMKVWSQDIRLHLSGDWSSIYQHFSAAAQGRYLWFSADVKAEMNNMRISGALKVDLEIDGTLPNADKLEAEINKRADLITQKFMEQAAKTIFDPPPPNVAPAEAKSNPLAAFELGVALKFRQDTRETHLKYEETRAHQYIQPHFISSSLEGFYDEIKADPKNEKKYFTRVFLDDWERKVRRVIKPVINWPDPERKLIGEPVAFASAQVGYPNTDGALQWEATMFQPGQAPDVTFISDTSMKKLAEVTTPPPKWTPESTFVKRAIHLREPPSELESPYMRIFVEKNVIELDPPGGTLTNEINLEVRAESAGKLEVGPISLDARLEGADQIIEVEIQPIKDDKQTPLRAPTRFRWSAADQDMDRFLTVYTGDLDYRPRYNYRVTVTVKGSIFSQGMTWTGEWVERAGNGAVMINVPRGVQPKFIEEESLKDRRERLYPDEVTGPGKPPSAGGGPGRPPRNEERYVDEQQVDGYVYREVPPPPVAEPRRREERTNGKKSPPTPSARDRE